MWSAVWYVCVWIRHHAHTACGFAAVRINVVVAWQTGQSGWASGACTPSLTFENDFCFVRNDLANLRAMRFNIVFDVSRQSARVTMLLATTHSQHSAAVCSQFKTCAISVLFFVCLRVRLFLANCDFEYSRFDSDQHKNYRNGTIYPSHITTSDEVIIPRKRTIRNRIRFTSSQCTLLIPLCVCTRVPSLRSTASEIQISCRSITWICMNLIFVLFRWPTSCCRRCLTTFCFDSNENDLIWRTKQPQKQ